MSSTLNDSTQLNLHLVGIVQDIKANRLEAYYGSVLLWSTLVEEPGCEGEATEFYTETVITLVNSWSGMSNHSKMILLASESSRVAEADSSERPLLGAYCRI